MNNLFFAISLALLNNENIVVNTNSYEVTLDLIQLVLKSHTDLKVIEIDLDHVDCVDTLIDDMMYKDLTMLDGLDDLGDNNLVGNNLAGSPNTLSDDLPRNHTAYKLYDVILWKHLNNCSPNFQRQLVTLFDQLNQYDTNDSRLNPTTTIKLGNKQVLKPTFNVIIGLLTITPEAPAINLAKLLKEQFWFSHFYLIDQSNDSPSNVEASESLDLQFHDYKNRLIKTRQSVIPEIYQAPDITGYIYSLIIHIRNHRLMTLGSIQSRLSTKVIDKVSLLAKSIIAWQQLQKQLQQLQQLQLQQDGKAGLAGGSTPFVTPVYCKIAIRKIGYWLVDWQMKGGLFDLTDDSIANNQELENKRKLVINMLAGEWYGSEWEYVKEYLGDYYGVYDPSSNTGFSNKIIEDSIKLVKPPM